jgi:hypothetical protein
VSHVTARPELRREFAIGFAASLSYFVVLLLLPAIFFFNVFVLFALAYFAGGVILASLLLGAPLALVGQTIAHHFSRPGIGLLIYFVVGALTAFLAFGVFALMYTGQFQPFIALGSDSPLGVGIVIVLAGLCAVAGWTTARKNTSPTRYDDALEGLDFNELAELIRNARQGDN